MKFRGLVVAVSLLALVATGCSDSSPDDEAGGATDTETGMPSMDMGETESFTFGRPGDPSEADRTVEITQLDTFAFDPSELEVQMGETITFAVTNAGEARHEFVLGDEMKQQEHESVMQDMGGEMMPDEPNAIAVEPGETKSLTWTFTEMGTLQYGCHVSGHFAQGMVGTIDVAM